MKVLLLLFGFCQSLKNVLLNTAASNNTDLLKVSRITEQIQYSTVVFVGTPPVAYSMVIDTGSSDVWLQGVKCLDCGLQNRKGFDTKASSTYQVEDSGENWFHVKYGSGQVSGEIGADVMRVGEFLFPEKMIIGVTQDEDGDMSRVLRANGILGLGLAGLAEYTIPAVSTYLDSFALLLEQQTGTLTINGILKEYDNDDTSWATMPVEKFEGSYDYWAVGMPHVQFGGEFVCGHAQKRCQAIIDSGTGFIAAPQSVWPKLLRIFRQAGCEDIFEDSSMQRCPIYSLPEFRFTLGSYHGYDFNVSLSQYTLPSGNDNFVIVAIIPSPIESDVWILGNIFLTHYYLQFDIKNHQVQFTASGTSFASNQVPSSDQPSYFEQVYDAKIAHYCMYLGLVILCLLLVTWAANGVPLKVNGPVQASAGASLQVGLLQGYKQSEKAKQPSAV